jgi:hypothetical protein
MCSAGYLITNKEDIMKRMLHYKNYNNQLQRSEDVDFLFFDKRLVTKFRDIEPYKERIKNGKSNKKRFSAKNNYNVLV